MILTGLIGGRADPLPVDAARSEWPAGSEIGEAQPFVSNIDYARLDARLQQLIAGDKMVGLAVGIVENGEIRFLKGYGVTQAGSNDTVTPSTIFRWASVSKGVAGDMIAKLAEQEKLSLYEPVAKYSASLRLPGGNEHRATISDLLSHRLGLFGHANDAKLEDGGDARLLRANLATLNAICPPGNCHAYQNVAYDAASEIVEKVTGQTYEQAVREQLFLPLGMTSATISRDGLLTARSWARPHRGGKNSKPVEVTDSYYRVPAAGGVNSSVKDLAIWMRAQMGAEPGVLPPKVLANVQSPRANTPGEQARKRKFRERLSMATYGLGWRIYDYAGNTVVGHHGGVTGYRSLIMFDPDRKAGVVALWNSSTSQPGGLEFEVMDMVYQLPFKDWLGLDGRPGAAPATPAEPGNVAAPAVATGNLAS
ncbi:MAG TPA: serine hydrolase domain-containing protein [Allosphingosinicella sp.]|jgi:beta-lactamase class C